MSDSLLVPLFSIQAPLLQAVSTSHSYLATGGQLMHDTMALDGYLRDAVVAEPAENGTDIYLDCHRMNLSEARKIFLKIRDRRGEINNDYPLLAPVAALLDDMAHMVTNILPSTEMRPRKIATLALDGTSFAFEQVKKRSVVWTMAIYFGISPEPLFGTSLNLRNEGVALALGRFGLGVYAYLGYVFVPALGAEQCLTPEIAREWSRRRIAPAPVHRSEDGSYFLDPRSA